MLSYPRRDAMSGKKQQNYQVTFMKSVQPKGMCAKQGYSLIALEKRAMVSPLGDQVPPVLTPAHHGGSNLLTFQGCTNPVNKDVFVFYNEIG
jgi:hypothetical protein